MGRDLISRILYAPDELLTPYDGHRRDPHNGSLQMRCSKITSAIDKLSVNKKKPNCTASFHENLGAQHQSSNQLPCGGGRYAMLLLHNIVVTFCTCTISASRGGIGLGAVANSSEGTGLSLLLSFIIIIICLTIAQGVQRMP
jgi:hypothetical protein